MNFASNPVLGKTQKFVELRLSTVNTADKLIYVFTPITIAEGLTDHYYWHTSMYSITEVTEGRVSELEAYSDYIKNSEFETGNMF